MCRTGGYLQYVQVSIPLEQLDVHLPIARFNGIDDLTIVPRLPYIRTKRGANLLDFVTYLQLGNT